MPPAAQVIADSISPAGIRLTTLEVVMHRFVLAEFNTHRVFSRNSASSRAIPVAKQLARVRDDPAMPISFPAERKGMQGGEPLTGADLFTAQMRWKIAACAALYHAEELAKLGVHKSVTNRLLEPFMWHTVVVSSTDWTGFFAQRCSPLAQPEIRVVAEAMRDAIEASVPRELTFGQWHTPYWRPGLEVIELGMDLPEGIDTTTDVAKAASVARCARVSYLTQDGKRDIAADLRLWDRLRSADPPHASPFEHVATPTRITEPALGNFRGWRQYRQDLFPYRP